MRNTDTTKASEGHKIWVKNNIDKYNLNPNYCKQCNKKILYEKRHNNFCSHSCVAFYTNKRKIRKEKQNKVCILCKKPIFTNHERHKLCETKFKVENGKHVCKGALRNYLIKTRGHKCEQCHNTYWEGELIPLDTHHIDGNDKNNYPKNLKLLCKNCHAQTDNYGCKHNRRKLI